MASSLGDRLRRHLQPVPPQPPENLRWVRGDGSEIPLECRYLGHQFGMHQWAAVITPYVDVTNGRIEIDVMPPHTRIGICVMTDICPYGDDHD